MAQIVRPDARYQHSYLEALDEFGIANEVRVTSAHRTPELMFEYAATALDRGLEAIIAGAGRLPVLLAEAVEAPLVFALEGVTPALAAEPFRLERLVPLMDRLLDQGVTQVAFAGAVRRPRLDPEAFDPRTATLVPRRPQRIDPAPLLEAAVRATLAVPLPPARRRQRA